MLLKFLHKFFARPDTPWVNLIWENYYSEGELPGQRKRGSFWWRDVVKLLNSFKGMSKVTAKDGASVLFWYDLWNGQVTSQAYPELFSFAKDPWITFRNMTRRNPASQHFHLPLSTQAHQQLQSLLNSIPDTQQQQGMDSWTYTGGNSGFSTGKAYKIMVGHRPTHPVFRWLWNSKCQIKHKVFFWLLLKDRLSTRELLHRKGMELDSHTCDLCILQRPETTGHLFLRCNFAKACWETIGVLVAPTRNVSQNLNRMKQQLGVSFFMEIIVLMTWSIWTTRNDWIFREVDPSIPNCKRKFMEEFSLLQHRVKPEQVMIMTAWLDSI